MKKNHIISIFVVSFICLVQTITANNKELLQSVNKTIDICLPVT